MIDCLSNEYIRLLIVTLVFNDVLTLQENLLKVTVLSIISKSVMTFINCMD